MIPWAILSSQSKWHHDHFSRFRTGDRSVSLYFTMGYPFPSKLPHPMGDLEPRLTHDSLGPSKPTTQTASRLVLPFCTDDHRVSLYFTMVCNFPPKIVPFHGGFGPHLICGSLGLPESSIQTVSQSVQPFLQGSLV